MQQGQKIPSEISREECTSGVHGRLLEKECVYVVQGAWFCKPGIKVKSKVMVRCESGICLGMKDRTHEETHRHTDTVLNVKNSSEKSRRSISMSRDFLGDMELRASFNLPSPPEVLPGLLICASDSQNRAEGCALVRDDASIPTIWTRTRDKVTRGDDGHKAPRGRCARRSQEAEGRCQRGNGDRQQSGEADQETKSKTSWRPGTVKERASQLGRIELLAREGSSFGLLAQASLESLICMFA